MVTPENSINIFLAQDKSPWSLTGHGKAATHIHAFMQSHDRGNPYTPLLIVLDHLSGYAPFHERTWGVLERTEGDWEIFDLLEHQLYFSNTRFSYPDKATNPEADYLHPTPYGEISDVMLNTVTGATMSRYPCILLAGDMDLSPFFLFELGKAAKAGSRILLHPRHATAMGETNLKKLQASGKVEVIKTEKHPTTQRSTAVSHSTLAGINRELFPFEISGNNIQYQVNRNKKGWVLELINNEGVYKTGDQPAIVYNEAESNVRINPRFDYQNVREWITDEPMTVKKEETFLLTIPPGEIRFVEFEIK